MTEKRLARGWVFACTMLACATAIAQDGARVEVLLVAKLDEPRGYCLDLPGHQQRARTDRGLHAHSCYSYQGGLGVDQAFDAARLRAGEFRLPEFDACMEARAPRAGARLQLAACNGSGAQRFALESSGRIVPLESRQLCLTVAAGSGVPGGGGNPVHVLRPLTLEPCLSAKAEYQTWRVRSGYD